MKKFVAGFCVLCVAGWAAYLYGFARPDQVVTPTDITYQQDPRLAPMVRQMETLGETMRHHLDALGKSEKDRSRPAAALPAQPLRDPFKPIP